jgi:hypothetical protein
MKLSKKFIAVPALALAPGISLAACSSQSPAPATSSAPATQAPIIINNNNNPAPAPVVVQPAPVYQAPAQQSSAWSTAVAYTSDINSGDNWDAWNLLSPSLQSSGWGSYSSFVADFTPLSFDNVSYVSQSGDAVSFTFTLHNHSTGSTQFTNCTYTVDDGIITSST